MAVKLISIKEKVITSPVPRIACSHHGSEVDFPKKDHCVSSSQMLVRMAVRMDQHFSTLFGMQTHFQSTQTSVVHPTYVLWPSNALQYQAVAHPTYMLWPTNGPWPTG